jgi:hypothetical protein
MKTGKLTAVNLKAGVFAESFGMFVRVYFMELEKFWDECGLEIWSEERCGLLGCACMGSRAIAYLNGGITTEKGLRETPSNSMGRVLAKYIIIHPTTYARPGRLSAIQCMPSQFIYRRASKP